MEYKVSRIHMKKELRWTEKKTSEFLQETEGTFKMGNWRRYNRRAIYKDRARVKIPWRAGEAPVGTGSSHWRESLTGTVTFAVEFSWCQTNTFRDRDGSCGLKCQTTLFLKPLTFSGCPLLMKLNQKQSPCRLFSTSWSRVEKDGGCSWSSQWRISGTDFIGKFEAYRFAYHAMWWWIV